MASIRQLSFTGGELSSDLWARSDLAKHTAGTKRLRNFFVSRRGAAVSRPGTTYCATAKGGGAYPVRLETFAFSDDQAFALEFGDTTGAGAGYIRFYQNGLPVLLTGTPYEVSTPYSAADLFKLKFSQQGNTITITHSSYPPKELTRVTDTSWTLADIDFSIPSYIQGGFGPAWSMSVSAPNQPGAYSNVTNYVTGSVVTSGGHAWVSTAGVAGGPYNVGNTPGSSSPFWVQDDNLLGRPWIWCATALWQAGGTGPIIEGIGYEDGSSGSPIPLSSNQPANITTVNNSAPYGATIWGFKIYRGLLVNLSTKPVFGLVGVQTGAGPFADVGDTPDYTQQPPQGLNPFTTTAVYPLATRTVPPGSATDYPSCACFFEQRRVFARTPSRPAWLFATAVGNYFNLDQYIYPVDSSPLRIEIASRSFLEVRSLLGFQKMLAFCNNGVWSIGGPGEQPLTPSGIDAKEQTEHGSSWLTPIQLQDAALYTRSKGTGVRELIFNTLQGKFSVLDISVFSEHLFTGYGVTDWAYAEDPWSVVWAVRSDGTMLSLTYVKDQELAAWSWHDTQGKYESVCAVPNGIVDDVYVAVLRTVNGTQVRFIERMANRVFTDATNISSCICVDAATQQITGSPTTGVSGIDYLEGCTVYGLADGAVVGPFTVTAGAITLETAARIITVGLAFTPQLQRLPVAMQQLEVRNKTKTISTVAFEVDHSRGLSVGQDFEHLDTWAPRDPTDGFSPPGLTTELVKMPVQSSYDYDGTACLQQDFPLPVTVTGITVDVKVGDD